MKGLFVLLCVFLLVVGLVSATIEADFDCGVGDCVEGSSMKWSITVFNNINSSIVVGQLFVVDVDTNQLIALHNSEDIELAPKELHVFKFENLVPAPLNGGYTFQFKPCFNASLSNLSAVVCKDAVESFSVIPLSKIECFSSSDCDTNKFCFGDIKKCRILDCKSGEVIVGHECVLPVCSWFEINSSSGCSVNPLFLLSAVLVFVGIILFVIASRVKSKKVKNKKGSKKLY